MNISLHLLNASGRLDPIRRDIWQAFETALPRILSLLPVDDVDVVVQPGPHVIPEVGMAGNSYRADNLYISIDPDNPNLRRNFAQEFTAQLGHELHHVMRIRGPGYGRTLLEALVSEGLACHFESELRGGNDPFYATGPDGPALAKIEIAANGELDSAHYDHRAWFFGTDPDRLPRFAGYALGFKLVERYIQRHRKLASVLYDVSAGEIAATTTRAGT